MFENDQAKGYRDPDTFDVRGSIRSMIDATRRHKALVAMSCALSVSLVAMYTSLYPPIYVANARVMAEKAIDNSRDNFYTSWAVFRKDDPATEIELMTSPSLIAEVVKKEKLKYDDVYHPLLSHLGHVWKGSVAGRFFTDVKSWIAPKTVDPDAPSASDIELAKTVTDMRHGISVVPVADSNLGDLTVKGPSRRVASIANTLLDLYMKRRAERYEAEAQRNLDALDREVEIAAKEAKEISDRRLAFVQANALTFDLSRESQQLTKVVELEDGISANRAKAASLQASLRLVESQLAQEPVNRTSSSTVELNTLRETSRLKRLDLETGLLSLRAVYKEDSPEVREVVQNIKDLDVIIAREPERIEKTTTSTLNSTRQDLITSRNSLRAQLEGVQNGMAVMEATERGMRSRLAAVPELQNTMRDMDRQYSLVHDRYQALSAKRAQAAVSKAMAANSMPSLQVVERASKPDEPAWPKTKLMYPSALVIGLMLGVLGAVIRSSTSGRVRRQDLEGNPDETFYGTIRIAIGTRPFTVAGERRARSRYSEDEV